MHHPERRTQHGDTFNEDAVALVQVDELRTQAFAGTENALVHVDTVLSELQKVCTSAGILLFLGYDDVFALRCLAAHEPPCLVGAVAVDGSFTCDSDVFLLVCVDKRLVIPAIETFPPRRHIGVELAVECKKQGRSLLDDEVYAAFQHDATCVPCSGGNNDAATACLRARINGLVDSFLVFCSIIHFK